jgi:hypothetical protein
MHSDKKCRLKWGNCPFSSVIFPNKHQKEPVPVGMAIASQAYSRLFCLISEWEKQNETNDATCATRFYFDRIDDRRGDYRYSGRDRDSAI